MIFSQSLTFDLIPSGFPFPTPIPPRQGAAIELLLLFSCLQTHLQVPSLSIQNNFNTCKYLSFTALNLLVDHGGSWHTVDHRRSWNTVAPWVISCWSRISVIGVSQWMTRIDLWVAIGGGIQYIWGPKWVMRQFTTHLMETYKISRALGDWTLGYLRFNVQTI